MMYVIKSEKGFTLAELLGVITILAIISLITVPLVNKYILSSRQKAYDVEIVTLKKAGQQWFTRNSTSVIFDKNNFYALNLGVLKQSEFLADEPIYNPLNPDEELTGCIMIKKNDNNYSYAYSSTCTGTFDIYVNGTAVYFNPVTGTKCTSAESVSTTGTKTGCMKWYTFNDAGAASDTINLILDHNTTALLAWNSSGTNVNGPDQLLIQLKIDTAGWTGVETRNDTYTVNYGYTNYIIDYSTYKARLITANEIANITGNETFNELTSYSPDWFYLDSNNHTQESTTQGESNYAWLFDYTNGCTSYGCNIADTNTYGYWTATAATGETAFAWNISRYGYMSVYNINSIGDRGVRPVITISKSSL